MRLAAVFRRGVLLVPLLLLGGCDTVSSLIDYDSPPAAAAPTDVVIATTAVPAVDPGEAFCRSYAHDTAVLAISRHEAPGPVDVLTNRLYGECIFPLTKSRTEVWTK